MGRRKYNVDESFFESIDSPEKAYWLGWMLSDGYNNEKKGDIAISLQEGDVDVLFLLQKLIKSEKEPIFLEKKRENWSNQYRLIIHSKKISEDLSKLGVKQAKSKSVELPLIDGNFLKYLIRGVFEGDGCFSFSKRKNNAVVGQFYICSASEKFIDQIINVFLNEVGINLIKRKSEWGVYYASTSGNNKVIDVISWIYSDRLELSLERKIKNYNEFLRQNEKRKLEIKKKKERVCLIEGCSGKYHSNGYCNKHAWQLWANGDPLFREKQKKETEIVYQYDLDGRFIKEWEFLLDAAKFENILPNNIRDSLDKENRRAGNFQWRSSFDKKITKYTKYTSWNCRIVERKNIDGSDAKKYSSLKEASRENNVSPYLIKRAIMNNEILNNFIWSFHNVTHR